MTQWVHSTFLYKAKHFIHHSLLFFFFNFGLLGSLSPPPEMFLILAPFGWCYPRFRKPFTPLLNVEIWWCGCFNCGINKEANALRRYHPTQPAKTIQYSIITYYSVKTFSGWKGGDRITPKWMKKKKMAF